MNAAYYLVWDHLSQGRSVVANYIKAQDSPDLVARSRPLVDYLRSCGVVEETQTDIQFQNGAWLHLRKPTKPRAIVPPLDLPTVTVDE